MFSNYCYYFIKYHVYNSICMCIYRCVSVCVSLYIYILFYIHMKWYIYIYIQYISYVHTASKATNISQNQLRLLLAVSGRPGLRQDANHRHLRMRRGRRLFVAPARLDGSCTLLGCFMALVYPHYCIYPLVIKHGSGKCPMNGGFNIAIEHRRLVCWFTYQKIVFFHIFCIYQITDGSKM